jgi:hypothetical protein
MPLSSQPDTFGVLRAMQGVILSECLVGGVTPFTALSASDAARYGVSNAVFVGRPKDFADAYLPQCCIYLPPGAETATLNGNSGRGSSVIEAVVLALVDQRADWYAGEQQILAIRDALWPVLLRHARLGGSVSSVNASDALIGRGLGYEQIAGVEYRTFAARWRVRQQWLTSVAAP